MKFPFALLIAIVCGAALAADEPRSSEDAQSFETLKKEIAELRKQFAEYSAKLKTMSDAELIALRKMEKDTFKHRLLFSALKNRIVLGISRTEERNMLGEPTSSTSTVDFYDDTIRFSGPPITQGTRIHFENDKVILIEPVPQLEKSKAQSPCDR